MLVHQQHNTLNISPPRTHRCAWGNSNSFACSFCQDHFTLFAAQTKNAHPTPQCWPLGWEQCYLCHVWLAASPHGRFWDGKAKIVSTVIWVMSWDTSQNLGNPEFQEENFVQNPEGMHRKFWDPHFSNAVASVELGITILALHSQN